MKTVRELHDKAMDLAQAALVARHQGRPAEADLLTRQAYEYEAQAADLVPEEPNSEPTRSILYRSAASLAYQCGAFPAAQRLIAKGLSGYPPPQIEQELKVLYEQVNEAVGISDYRQESAEVIELEGVVDYASSRQGNIIGLTTGDNRQYYVIIEEAIDELVQSYFNQAVKVTGYTSDKKNVYLSTIQRLG